MSSKWRNVLCYICLLARICIPGCYCACTGFVLFYEAINGFHDTANAVATVIYTRAMRSQLAVVMAAVFNFLGVLLGGLSVAYAIVHMLPTDLLLNMGSSHGLAMVFSMLLAAIIWNTGTGTLVYLHPALIR